MKKTLGLAVICAIGLAGCQSTTTNMAPAAVATSGSLTLKQVRLNAGVPPLKYNGALTRAAQHHANDMVRRGFYAHVNPDGVNFDKRVSDEGYCVASLAENLTEKAKTEEQAIQMWMNSPPHRRNMLNPKYTHVGIGSAGGYWVMDLGGKCVR
ncbi:CAP domain-containing protein [Thalassovita sp.]|jgi:uncharacterized protein YkwD|uniref:CAP domain-containing protein n=1 Tax=Thalassovita sp. TaxID=1979401 RepID=UPI003B5A974B